jgi:D-amino-acid oxidase
MEILVLGCGVSGLTSGIALQRAGHHVTIWTKALPPNTTSNVAAAVWYPYKAFPIERVTAWGAQAYSVFRDLARVEGAGVAMAEVLEVRDAPGPDPWWAGAVDGFRHARPDELPPGYGDGYVFAAPVMDMPVYLDYLVSEFHTASGGPITQREVVRLDELPAAYPVVVNCTGLGARELCADSDLHPSRGQVARVRHNGFRRVLLDDVGPNKVAYIVPRIHDIVLGGVDEEHNESTAVDPHQTESILRRCAALAPAFADLSPADVVSVACGLRPVRSSVRLEAEPLGDGRVVIHNYGHGGAGVTLSWGCARDVVDLVAAI